MEDAQAPENFSAQTAPLDDAQPKTRHEVAKLVKKMEKLDKETEKVELELRELRRPWWQRSQMLVALLPSLIALGTLAAGYVTGWFQAESTSLENKKHDLSQDVAALKLGKERLATERIAMQRQLSVELTDLQKMLTGERAVTQYSIRSERSKAEALRASIRAQMQFREVRTGKDRPRGKLRNVV